MIPIGISCGAKSVRASTSAQTSRIAPMSAATATTRTAWCGRPVAATAARGVAVVGIAYKDEPVATRAFLDELGDPYSMVLVDREGRAGLDLGISGVPETFAVDARGRIAAKQSGPLLDEADIERLVASIQAPAAR